MNINDILNQKKPVMPHPEKYMLSRDGAMRGEIINRFCYRCQMEGCTGWRIFVKWPNGRRTFPCSKGCKSIDKDTLQII